jgi:hypothetical protein
VRLSAGLAVVLAESRLVFWVWDSSCPLARSRAARKSERRCFEKSFLSLMARIPVQKGFLTFAGEHRAPVASNDRRDEGRIIPQKNARTDRPRSRGPRIYESILGEKISRIGLEMATANLQTHLIYYARRASSRVWRILVTDSCG